MKQLMKRNKIPIRILFLGILFMILIPSFIQTGMNKDDNFENPRNYSNRTPNSQVDPEGNEISVVLSLNTTELPAGQSIGFSAIYTGSENPGLLRICTSYEGYSTVEYSFDMYEADPDNTDYASGKEYITNISQSLLSIIMPNHFDFYCYAIPTFKNVVVGFNGDESNVEYFQIVTAPPIVDDITLSQHQVYFNEQSRTFLECSVSDFDTALEDLSGKTFLKNTVNDEQVLVLMHPLSYYVSDYICNELPFYNYLEFMLNDMGDIFATVEELEAEINTPTCLYARIDTRSDPINTVINSAGPCILNYTVQITDGNASSSSVPILQTVNFYEDIESINRPNIAPSLSASINPRPIWIENPVYPTISVTYYDEEDYQPDTIRMFVYDPAGNTRSYTLAYDTEKTPIHNSPDDGIVYSIDIEPYGNQFEDEGVYRAYFTFSDEDNDCRYPLDSSQTVKLFYVGDLVALLGGEVSQTRIDYYDTDKITFSIDYMHYQNTAPDSDVILTLKNPRSGTINTHPCVLIETDPKISKGTTYTYSMLIGDTGFEDIGTYEFWFSTMVDSTPVQSQVYKGPSVSREQFSAIFVNGPTRVRINSSQILSFETFYQDRYSLPDSAKLYIIPLGEEENTTEYNLAHAISDVDYQDGVIYNISLVEGEGILNRTGSYEYWIVFNRDGEVQRIPGMEDNYQFSIHSETTIISTITDSEIFLEKGKGEEAEIHFTLLDPLNRSYLTSFHKPYFRIRYENNTKDKVPLIWGDNLMEVDKYDDNWVDGKDFYFKLTEGEGVLNAEGVIEGYLEIIPEDGDEALFCPGPHEYTYTTVFKIYDYASFTYDAAVHSSLTPTIDQNFKWKSGEDIIFIVNYSQPQNFEPKMIALAIDDGIVPDQKPHYPMEKLDPSDNNYTDGCLYSIKVEMGGELLPSIGDYSYDFYYGIEHHRIFRGDLGQGEFYAFTIENDAPQLSNILVDDPILKIGESIPIVVNYTDSDGVAPDEIKLSLYNEGDEGVFDHYTNFTMTPQTVNNRDYTMGVLYIAMVEAGTYRFSELGNYSYCIWATDGLETDLLTETDSTLYPELEIQDSMFTLSEGSSNPAVVNYSNPTNVNFLVYYTDPDGDFPTYVNVSIYSGDTLETTYDLAQIGGIHSDTTRPVPYAILRDVTASLTPGNYTYVFGAFDGTTYLELADESFTLEIQPSMFTLSDGSATPAVVNYSNPSDVDFLIHYTDPDGDFPTHVNVSIYSGSTLETTYDLTLIGSFSDTTGLTPYGISQDVTASLTPGNYTYVFGAFDGTTYLEWSEENFKLEVKNSLPLLKNGSVSNATLDFAYPTNTTFSVYFQDNDGPLPELVTLCIYTTAGQSVVNYTMTQANLGITTAESWVEYIFTGNLFLNITTTGTFYWGVVAQDEYDEVQLSDLTFILTISNSTTVPSPTDTTTTTTTTTTTGTNSSTSSTTDTTEPEGGGGGIPGYSVGLLLSCVFLSLAIIFKKHPKSFN
ncbi:hypothetical protein NEF87_002372 [Candidatus Lokiarchaeum ossiferum]|uniref:Uncharacterized protein n=1 Tax=Candidatus Lokiarchaeum ossiferum TaxID=2951803 RepID=A0ABY6HUQ3_9ARCH|nr:hypothetical protein NEF87_002372 [Candidatus Lokiarchaeum sp. B-35]